MEYERIHKPQTGIISPSKMRMKLVEVHNQIRKAGSNRSSPRSSPSRTEDFEVVNNSLLTDSDFDDDGDDQGSSLEVSPANSSSQVDQPKEALAGVKVQQISKGDSGKSSSVQPMRTVEEDNLDYDSNASSFSFEFHKAERAAHNQVYRAFPRPMSSKWNDAEKWIISRQVVQGGHSGNRRGLVQSQASRVPRGNVERVAPEGGGNDKLGCNKLFETKRVDFCVHVPAKELEFSFVAPVKDCGSSLTNPYAQHKDTKEFNHSPAEDSSGLAIRAVCMRDTGTEMTPIASQDPSRTSTPVGASSPLRSPSPSLPSTPRRGPPTSTLADFIPIGDDNRLLSEEELKLKTRREIMALGVQLGKVNIAAWASNEENKRHSTPVRTVASKEIEKLEYEKRAAAWIDVEKTKHAASLKREENKIQAWESHEKTKLEANMRRTEAQIDQLRAQAQAKMVKKISMAKQKAEKQRVKAEARNNRWAEKTAAQAEYIRRTGQLPSTSPLSCCGLL